MGCAEFCSRLGEYLIGGGSDAARLLPVEMQKPDGGKLKYFQDNPLIVSTFYYYFIKWYIENYREIVATLEQWVNQYREIDMGIHNRLQETHLLFNTVYGLVMEYCYEKEILSATDVKRFHKSFLDLLTKLVQQQNQRVHEGICTASNCKDYLTQIQVLYRGGKLAVAADVAQFKEGLYDGLIHRKCLYLRGNKISECFPEVDVTEIAIDLASKGALEAGKSSYTKQISALHGMRFYVIPLGFL